MLRVIFLGTSSARPTVTRNTSALAVQRGGDLYLFDCGEGTQRQMMRYGVGFTVQAIFITHMHADHYLGALGLLRTMSLQGRERPLSIYVPPVGEELLREAIRLELETLAFPIEIESIQPGGSVCRDDYTISAYAVDHGISANGYVLREDERPGRFHPERALDLGVPEGPSFGRLQRGEAVESESGREVRPEDVMGPPRPGRVMVYSGDTRPCQATVEVAEGADLLIHEATFSEEEWDRASRAGHSTAHGAAEIARQAGVGQLVLTHLSARYSERAHILLREAKRVCGDVCDVLVAKDGLALEVPLRDASDGRLES